MMHGAERRRTVQKQKEEWQKEERHRCFGSGKRRRSASHLVSAPAADQQL